ncbi:MAG: c-type cytochrome [Bryobacteraceae bacterium]
MNRFRTEWPAIAPMCLLAVWPLAGQPVAGLIGKFGDGAATVVFVSRAPNFYLDAEESIHPALGARFRGQWEGSLRVLAAGNYEFNRTVNLDGGAGTKHTLNAGMHALAIPFERAAGSAAQLRLEWRSAGFDWEPVPREAFFHDRAAAPSRAADEGRRLVADARCASCHSAPGLERTVPGLDGIGSRTNRTWLYAFLRRHAVVAQTAEQSADLAAYLAGRKSAVAFTPRKANEVSIGKGGELFGTMGCVFCHPSGSMEAMGSKYTLTVLTAALLETHRPSMLLDEGDATALAAYLTRSTDVSFEGAAPVGDAARGENLMASLGCAGCHERGKNAGPPLRGVDCRIVRSGWTPAQKESVRAFLRGNVAAKSPAPVFTLPYELERYQCLTCHKPGTEAPDLDGVGEKLKTSWIGKVLWDKKRIRHGRELRMPHYGEAEMRPLALALAKLEGLAPGDGPPPPASTDAVRETGVGLLGTNVKKQGMACIGCHDWGVNKSLGEESPQLQNAAERLRFDWYKRWMRNPARILSGTSMPNYFGGMTPERARPRMHALWAAMEWGAKAPAPDGFRVSDLEVTAEAKPVVGKEAVVVRWDMPEATPAAIAVGLPGGFSYCFDAGRSKLLYAWRGGFLDMTGTLLRKTDNKKLTPTAGIIGEIFWRAGNDYPVLVGNDKRTPQRKFKGYRLVDGAPEFRYLLDGMLITERLVAEPKTIRRRLTFDRIDGPVYLEGKLLERGRNVVAEGTLQ